MPTPRVKQHSGERHLAEFFILATLMGALSVFISLRGEPTWISTDKLFELVREHALLLDVRPSGVSLARTLPGALHIPMRELAERIDEVPRDRAVVVFGSIGDDSVPAYRMLRARGIEAYDLGPISRFPRGAEHLGHRHGHHSHSH